MKCPVCNVALTMTERQGVEIDYCPQCRGVWLDRGELDKIIERGSQYGYNSTGTTMPPPAVNRQVSSYSQGYQPSAVPGDAPGYDPRERYTDDRYDRSGRRDDDYDEYGRGRKRKREGFLSELFDFD